MFASPNLHRSGKQGGVGVTTTPWFLTREEKKRLDPPRGSPSHETRDTNPKEKKATPRKWLKCPFPGTGQRERERERERDVLLCALISSPPSLPHFRPSLSPSFFYSSSTSFTSPLFLVPLYIITHLVLCIFILL